MYARNIVEIGVLNTLRGIAYTAPPKVYAGLLLSNPGDAGAVNEVNYQGYTRLEVTFSPPAYDATLNEFAIRNSNTATFPTAALAAGTVPYIGIFDAEVAGNCLLYGELESPIIIGAGESPTIVAGEVAYMSSGDFTNEFKARWMNFFRGITMPAITPYIALFRGANEIVATNYARVPVTFSAPTESETGIGSIVNDALVIFNQSSTPWGTYNAHVIMDGATGGNEIVRKSRGADKTIARLTRVQFAPGSIRIGMN